jgi:hypothetical protein
MKGKLIKLNVGVGYRLDDEHGNLFASTLQSSKTKLSIQNCDEIFGVVDVEKLAEKEYPNGIDGTDRSSEIYRRIYIEGFNKAMELNKYKLFTVEDMLNMYNQAFDIGYNFGHESGDSKIGNIDFNEALQFLQQPKEIEVEVIMDKIPADLAPGGWDEFPKLDENKCLILKRVV